MNTRLQTDVWIYRAFVVLGFIVAASLTGTVFSMFTGRPALEILFALGVVAVGGLVRLAISPLNREL